MHSPVRPRGRYELKRRYFHRGHLWPWILVILVPFVLRFVMFYDISFPFQSSPSSIPVIVRPAELIELYERARDNLGSSPPAPVIRPDEDAWMTLWNNNHAKRPMANTDIEMSKDGPTKREEIETSKGRDQTLTVRPNGQDLTDGSFVLPEEKEDIMKVASVAESQLRAIGERINAIKRFHGQKDNAEEMREMSRLKNGIDQRKAEGEERAKDGRIYILKQGLDEKQPAEDEADKSSAEEKKKAAEDKKAAAEADEDRMFAEELEADEQILVAEEAKDQRRPAEDTEAEERRFTKELEIVDEREEAAKDRMVATQIEVDEKRFAENSEADRRAADGREDEEEMALAKEREADEHGRAGEEMEAAEETKAANERDADEVRKATQKRESDDEKEAPTEDGNATQGNNSEMESTADEQGEAGEKTAAQDRAAAEQRRSSQGEQTAEEGMKVGDEGETGRDVEGEEEISASDKTEADESNIEGEKQSQQEDVDEKNLNKEEHKVVNNDEEEGSIKLHQSREETKDIEDQYPAEEKDKEEENRGESDPDFGEDVPSSKDQTEGESLTASECDLFDGDWEFDPEGPMYTNNTCFFIRGDHNCMSNGRPDTGYQSWRWKPRGCDLPRFDARAVMEAFRGKTIGYVGDSLARNQMQSMLCLLSLIEIPVLVHEDALTTRWYYEQHKVTLAAVWSPYLLKESEEGILGFEKGQIVVYLDVLDPVWTKALSHLDIVVFSVGQWYFKPSVYIMKDEIIGCHYCPKLNLTEIGFFQAYSEGLRNALEKVGNGDWKGTAIISTFAIGHGEKLGSGEEGDQCRRERPLEKEEFESSFQGMQDEMRDIVLTEFNSMMANDDNKLNNSEAHIQFLDVTKLSLLRADGHPGPFYLANPFEGKSPGELVFNDCLHWCLPGPVDTWNQLLVRVMHKQL